VLVVLQGTLTDHDEGITVYFMHADGSVHMLRVLQDSHAFDITVGGEHLQPCDFQFTVSFASRASPYFLTKLLLF
jgi:hypothetical protein